MSIADSCVAFGKLWGPILTKVELSCPHYQLRDGQQHEGSNSVQSLPLHGLEAPSEGSQFP